VRKVILVPYRPANDRHRWLWDNIRPELERFGWPIYVGTCEGKWSRAPAVNDAARQAGKWDVAFIADCDTIPEHDGILRAVEWVCSTGGGARPHAERYMLSGEGSLVALQRGVQYLEKKHFLKQWAGGGLDVVTRDAWDTVAALYPNQDGAFNEAYAGWGYEDSEFHVRLVVTSRWDRLPGQAWHLNHPTHENKAERETVQRFRELQRTCHDQLQAWIGNTGLKNGMAVF
jgi:hypothetical protein